MKCKRSVFRLEATKSASTMKNFDDISTCRLQPLSIMEKDNVDIGYFHKHLRNFIETCFKRLVKRQACVCLGFLQPWALV